MATISAANSRTQNIVNNSVSYFFEVNCEQIVRITKSSNIIAEGNKILISKLKIYFADSPIKISGKTK